MTTLEMKDMFDLLYNNSASDAVAPLSDYEISLYLTKAQEELLKNKINTLGNKYQTGAEESDKRILDMFNIVTVEYVPFIDTLTQFDERSKVADFSKINALKILNETLGFEFEYKPDGIEREKYQLLLKNLQVVTLSYNEYDRKMSKPYKYPLKNQVWKISSNNTTCEYILPYKMFVEDLLSEAMTTYTASGKIDKYKFPKDIKEYSYGIFVRYIRRPLPIVISDLPQDINGEQLTIEGISTETECELGEIMHNEIVQRAVELAKATYSYDQNGNAQMANQVQIGQRSE